MDAGKSLTISADVRFLRNILTVVIALTATSAGACLYLLLQQDAVVQLAGRF